LPACANCGAAAPADARFCSRCGAPLDDESGVEGCEIVLWRGYTTSEFTAVGRSGGDVVLRSRPFRWRKDAAPPEEEPYVSAHAELVRRLTGDGWVRSGRGDDWYSLAFTRGLRANEMP
jgi:zinc-ribbon domain